MIELPPPGPLRVIRPPPPPSLSPSLGSTPSKQSPAADPLVGASLSDQMTGNVAQRKTGYSTSDHSNTGMRTDCSSQLPDFSSTGSFYGQDLGTHSAQPSLGMYLSSVSRWNTGSCDIPQQFLTSLEPPYKLAMGNRIPLYKFGSFCVCLNSI